MEVKEGLLMGE
jgi:ribosome recycling factor